MYQSTKEYGHALGFSVAFRQWHADSHCKYLHGYSLAFKFVFEAQELDARGWVVDFGGFKDLKLWLSSMFDHKTIVATDDPEIEFFREGHNRGILDLVEISGTGCEKFADLVFSKTVSWLKSHEYSPRVSLVSVEVMEHGANSAIRVRHKNECVCS